MTRTRTFLNPGKLYRVKSTIVGFSVGDSNRNSIPTNFWKHHQIEPEMILLAIGQDDYPEWAAPDVGCWVLMNETKVWVREFQFCELEVVSV